MIKSAKLWDYLSISALLGGAALLTACAQSMGVL